MADETETQVLPESPELEEKLELLREHNRLLEENTNADIRRWEKATEHNESEIEYIEDSIAHLERKMRSTGKLEEAEKQQLATGRNQIKLIKEQNKLHGEAVKAIKAHERALEELEEDGENFSNTLLGLNAGLGGFTRKLFGTKGGLKAFGKGLRGLLNPFKLLLSFITKVIEQTVLLMVKIDKARGAFVKATGAAGKFEAEVVSLSYAMRGTGIRADEVAQAYGALYSNFVDFTKATGPQRLALTKTVAKFQELGVSAQLQSEIALEATRSLGFGFGEVEGVLRDVGGVAEALNEPFDKVMQNFKTVSKKLAFYGKNVMGVFKKLSAQAKSTGLSVDELLGVVEQFDTFEGAGKAVGKLNAIMGGPYLNSIDMLNASEEERVEILKRSMKQSGMNFKQMGKYEQKMVASSLGIGVEQARKLFGAETEQQKMERMKKSQLDARVSRGQDIQEKMLSLMESFALNWMPALEKLKTVLDTIAARVRDLLNWFQDLPGYQQVGLVLGSLFGTYVLSKLPAWLLKSGATRAGLGAVKAPKAPKAPRGWWDPRANRFRGKTGFVSGGGKPPSLLQRGMGRLRVATGRTGNLWSKPGTGGGRIGRGIKAVKGSRVGQFATRMGTGAKNLATALKGIKLPAPLVKLLSVFQGIGSATTGVTGAIKNFGKGILKWLYPVELAYHMIKSLIDNFHFFGDAVAEGDSFLERFTGSIGAFLIVIGEGAAAATDSLVNFFVWLANLLLPENWELPQLDLAGSIRRSLDNLDMGFIGETFEWMGREILKGLGSVLPNRVAKWLGIGDADFAGGTITFRGKQMSPAEVESILESEGVDDFIYRGPGKIGPGTITPIDNKDEFIGMKAGGAINQALRAMTNMGGGGSWGGGPQAPDKKPVIINVHIGQKKIETIVLDSLDSTAGKKKLSPFMRA